MPDIDPATLPDAPQDGSRYFTQADLDAAIAAAVKQQQPTPRLPKDDERYTALNAELKELRAFQRKAEAAETKRQQEIEAERKKAEEAKMTAEQVIQRRQEEMAAQLQSVQEQNSQQIALMAKELEFQKNSAYAQRRINEESDNIAPELIQFVTGNTPEEIEASIERVKATTASIVENMRSAGTRQRAAMPGVAPAAGTNGVGPLDTPGERSYSDKDIKDMGMAEYAALRQRLGLGGANNQGLFRA